LSSNAPRRVFASVFDFVGTLAVALEIAAMGSIATVVGRSRPALRGSRKTPTHV
jgi:hypothetical protein